MGIDVNGLVMGFRKVLSNRSKKGKDWGTVIYPEDEGQLILSYNYFSCGDEFLSTLSDVGDIFRIVVEYSERYDTPAQEIKQLISESDKALSIIYPGIKCFLKQESWHRPGEGVLTYVAGDTAIRFGINRVTKAYQLLSRKQKKLIWEALSHVERCDV